MHPENIQLQPVRETPPVSPNIESTGDPTRPPVPKEPILNLRNIQGNIIGGFNKDYQTMLFLRLRRDEDQAAHVENFRRWLAIFVPFIATSEEVLAFNRLFKLIRARRHVESRTIQATWINIAFSFNALKLMSPDAEEFTDEAFREGLAARAVNKLNDPISPSAEGNPKNWVFGGPGCEADAVIIIGSDDPNDLGATVESIETSIYGGRTPDGQAMNSGVQIIYKQQGATLPPPLTGHEHFGFLDGVSQPGIRGRLSDNPSDVLTPRQNPDDPEQGKPGQDLLWPGEFVFGYSGQKVDATEEEGGVAAEGPNSLKEGPDGRPAGPDWAQDGSYFVIRRLRQDVAGFHSFLKATGDSIHSDEATVGAKLVGRWKSGAPIMRARDDKKEPLKGDIPALGDDDCANNHFEYQEKTNPMTAPSGSDQCSDTTFPQSNGDKTGKVCPFGAHIRKAYPRNDTGTLATGIGEVSTQTHRLLRRGIPFGSPFFSPNDPAKTKDSGNRGLVFAAYQTSIVEQFEFVQSSWANNPNFKDVPDKHGNLVSGHDLIIGQTNNPDGSRERRCPIHVDGKRHEVVAPVDWVIPTGGGYFFAPSISALNMLAEASAE
jgi:Dyp-type peroxidase family